MDKVREAARIARKYGARPATKAPSLTTLERWLDNGIAKATDGCRVEPDGHCPHGCPSWLLKLGLI